MRDRVDAERLRAVAQKLPGIARPDAPLAQYSWVGIGGPADLMVVAEDSEALVRAVSLAREHDVPYRVFGGLTNVLVPDSGLAGVVVLNQARNVTFTADRKLVTDAGAIVVKVARQAVRTGWGGLTWAVGLPGTVGGAVINNAGAFGGETAKVLRRADLLAPDGTVVQVGPGWFEFGYRTSRLKGSDLDWLVLGAEFELRARDAGRLATKADEYTARRRRTQPPGKTLGSTFKNPPGDYAGRLIDAAGLKGTRRGGICVSEQHANFLINDRGGTASDFRSLVVQLQETVETRFGVRLETEIEMLPERQLV